MKRWFVPGFLAVLVLAAGLRLPELRLRPMHNDEAVNAKKFQLLWTGNNYKYDPNEFHGPTLPYFTLPAGWLDSSHDFDDFTETTFRLIAVAFGLGLIVILLLLTEDFGRMEILWASLFVALSPAMVFYSRYYIHEMLLVFFTALTATALWRYGKGDGFGWSILAGLGLGLMAATKETFVFAAVSLGLGAICATGWTRWRGGVAVNWGKGCKFKTMLAGLGVAAGVALLFFSSFFSNPAGIADAFKTYAPWLHRAQGASPHMHSWSFYFERLLFYRANGGPLWSEGFIAALALLGFIASLRGRGLGTTNVMLIRIIAFYTVWMTFIYTLLPYKTPWCLLGFFHGMILLAGVGAAVLIRRCKTPRLQAGMMILLLAGAAQLGWQAWRGSFAVDKGSVPYCDSIKNPYVYSQTTPDIYRLMATIDGLTTVTPAGYNTVIEVMSPDSYWPLPWYLRRFKLCGFWDKIPTQQLAPIMIVSTELQAKFDERPEKTHLMAGYFELRPNVFFELYVSADLWAKYIKVRQPEQE